MFDKLYYFISYYLKIILQTKISVTVKFSSHKLLFWYEITFKMLYFLSINVIIMRSLRSYPSVNVPYSVLGMRVPYEN